MFFCVLFLLINYLFLIQCFSVSVAVYLLWSALLVYLSLLYQCTHVNIPFWSFCFPLDRSITIALYQLTVFLVQAYNLKLFIFLCIKTLFCTAFDSFIRKHDFLFLQVMKRPVVTLFNKGVDKYLIRQVQVCFDILIPIIGFIIWKQLFRYHPGIITSSRTFLSSKALKCDKLHKHFHKQFHSTVKHVINGHYLVFSITAELSFI